MLENINQQRNLSNGCKTYYSTGYKTKQIVLVWSCTENGREQNSQKVLSTNLETIRLRGRLRNRWQDVSNEGWKTSWGNWVEGKNTQQRGMEEAPENGKAFCTCQIMNEWMNEWISVRNCTHFFFLLLWCGSTQAMVPSFMRFLDHTQWHTTVIRAPLDKWSAQRKELYLTTHNTHKRETSMTPGGIQTPQSH